MRALFDVLGVGCAAIDDVIYVDHNPGHDEKVKVTARSTDFGGLTATALVTAARLGAKTCYAGSLGYDADSRAVIRDLRQAGVKVPNRFRRPDAQPVHSTIIVCAEQGTRTIYFSDPVTGGAQGDIPEATIRSSRVLLLDGYGADGSLRAASIARDNSIPVVADLESDNEPLFPDLLAISDHLILSSGFATRITQRTRARDAVNDLWSPTRRVVVVTCGAAGSWFRISRGRTPEHLPAYPVSAVDTTGCGDVFHGAYAAALAFRKDIESAIRFANVAAALKVMVRGTRSGLPSREDVEIRLKALATEGAAPGTTMPEA
jgi:sugar/nucleoside kinase (ribokinase family)